MALDRTGNLLGALALVLTDRMTEAMAAEGGASASAAAALSWLHQFQQQPTVDLLGRVLGLTSSGTVRLLDRLVAEGYVERGSGTDGRATVISLTPAGRAAAENLALARGKVLDQALRSLSPAERRALEKLHSKLLIGLIRDPGGVRWMCRLCDTGACWAGPGCPVTNTVHARLAARQPS
ncbi:MAG TPA: MarR family transcriptional regulator [Candidatus Dormibacteraeota bacterium]